ncbi:hypothetical protein ABZV34_03815 [Streptomyces sp. NPDC005195]|uniref:hypothetical protein n=1 Tax=Streptomyces sp. NPDC005195 TaxID=3154561 RepID=UPI0033A9FCD5
MKTAMVSAVAAGMFLLGVGAATAQSWHEIPLMEPTGVAFVQGRYQFNPAGRNHGAFEWTGKLRDTSANDRHNVYMRVRVEGHGWVRYYGKQRQTVRMHHFNWDGAQQYTDDAEVQACRDLGTARLDNCSVPIHFKP